MRWDITPNLFISGKHIHKGASTNLSLYALALTSISRRWMTVKNDGPRWQSVHMQAISSFPLQSPAINYTHTCIKKHNCKSGNCRTQETGRDSWKIYIWAREQGKNTCPSERNNQFIISRRSNSIFELLTLVARGKLPDKKIAVCGNYDQLKMKSYAISFLDSFNCDEICA
jgi:hypothetical protein